MLPEVSVEAVEAGEGVKCTVWIDGGVVGVLNKILGLNVGDDCPILIGIFGK